jgi:hypothetical protein
MFFLFDFYKKRQKNRACGVALVKERGVKNSNVWKELNLVSLSFSFSGHLVRTYKIISQCNFCVKKNTSYEAR